jgi:hypothetical protein
MLKKLKAVIVGTVALCLKTMAVITFLVAVTVFALMAPQYLPVPNAWAEYSSGAIKGLSTLTGIAENINSTNGGLHAFGQLLSYEDTVNSVARTEQQFSYQTPVAVDTPVKPSAGYVHNFKCSPTDNASVAGTIQLRDATSAGTGNVVEEWTVLAIDYTTRVPITFAVDKIFATGIYLDFTTTTDIKCDVSFR